MERNLLRTKTEVVEAMIKHGKGVLSPCGECQSSPANCEILFDQDGALCVEKQKVISLNGSSEVDNV